MSALATEPVEAPPVEEGLRPVVTVLEMGRIIHLLRNESSWRTAASSRWGWRYPTRTRNRRKFTDAQIRDVLGLTDDEMVEYLAAYQTSLGRRWTRQTIFDAVLAFVAREGRWPVKADFPHELLPFSNGTFYRGLGFDDLASELLQRKNLRTLRALDPALILGFREVHRRQALVQAYGGIARVIRKGGGTKIQKDSFGTLWQLPPDQDTTEPHAMWLEVVNATAENGRREHFFLRVPPTMRTAQEAVAWTYGLDHIERFEAET